MVTDYAARARALVGTRFRPQGRGEEGLDCVGIVLRTYAIPDGEVRRDYRLRGNHRCEMERALSRFFRGVEMDDRRSGDLLLMAVAADQMHLAVQSEAGFVHAHCGIGRVIETPGNPQWPVLAVYRKQARSRSR